MMENLSDYTGNTLELIKPKFLKDNYELKLGEKTVGTLVFPKVFSTNAEISFRDSHWTIKKESFWRGILGIYKQNYELPSAKYIPDSFTKGQIKLYRGDYLFVKKYIFKDTIEIKNSMQKTIITAKVKSGLKKKFFIELHQKNKIIDENPWIILLLCYMLIRSEKQSKAAAG